MVLAMKRVARKSSVPPPPSIQISVKLDPAIVARAEHLAAKVARMKSRSLPRMSDTWREIIELGIVALERAHLRPT